MEGLWEFAWRAYRIPELAGFLRDTPNKLGSPTS